MSRELYKQLSTQSSFYESQLHVEQRMAVMLTKFSNHIQTKTLKQLLDIRIDLMQRYHEYYLDNHLVKLYLQMMYIVERRLRKLRGG